MSEFKCQHDECERKGNWFAAFTVWAQGTFQRHKGQGLTLVVGTLFCKDHAHDFPSEEFFTDEAVEQINRAIVNQGKMPIDVHSAETTPLRWDNPLARDAWSNVKKQSLN